MIEHNRRKEEEQRKGKGLANSIINNLPIELHVPGYQYCGPGTKLKERIARGDPGINPLDAACKEHDIAYSRNRKDLSARHSADRILAEKAWKRVIAKDASLAEKAVAWGVANTMKVKTKLGMGVGKRKKFAQKKVPLRDIVRAAKVSMHAGANAVKTALKGAREAVKNVGGKRRIQTPRVLPLPPKIGGILPFLIPIFAGLSATGALAGGAAGIAKAVNDANSAKHAFEESKRHNQAMEAIAVGKGLFLKPYKKGFGLRLKNA